ncbi:MAG: non-canonical purine NTP pyrophosphatase [Candidatus Kerfeldbacteria bacterium CG_4_9_14_3_um_filter_45_8]|nr:MAG: non-canonical purine NTP pyrophosphatase [Candidatus Kerfeldbacteria bacterium CG_4_9_14_3_um_filter_45_8]
MQLLLATNNADKHRELVKILGGTTFQKKQINVFRPAQLESSLLPTKPIIEDGDSFRDNARIKARAFSDRAGRHGYWVLAEDSGIVVDALPDELGVRSKRWFAEGDETVEGDNARNRELLRRLEGVEAGRRGASYVCSVIMLGPDAREYFHAYGTCDLQVLEAEDLVSTGGFAYDRITRPLDLPDARSMAALSDEEKNRISHRGRALQQLREFLAHSNH